METNKYANKTTAERRKELLERREEILERRNRLIEECDHKRWVNESKSKTDFLDERLYQYEIYVNEGKNWIYDNFPLRRTMSAWQG